MFLRWGVPLANSGMGITLGITSESSASITTCDQVDKMCDKQKRAYKKISVRGRMKR